MKTYINIRVVRADDIGDAWDKLLHEDFVEHDILCDSMIELDEQLREELERKMTWD